MTSGDAWNAGFYQSRRAHDLAEYQSSHGYNKQSAAIAQDQATGTVLMLAWMTEATLRETLETGRMVYWSRSRNGPC